MLRHKVEHCTHAATSTLCRLSTFLAKRPLLRAPLLRWLSDLFMSASMRRLPKESIRKGQRVDCTFAPMTRRRFHGMTVKILPFGATVSR